MIKLIAAIADNGVIGHNDELVWSYPEDLKHFKDTTMNQSILMGSKTYDGLPGTLPGRTTYVLTRDASKYSNNTKITAISDALELFKKFKSSKDILYISGGKSIYNNFHQFADEMIITHINEQYEGNVVWSEFEDIQKEFPYKEELSKNQDFTIVKYKKNRD